MKNKKGFTLVELLAVIAILAILVIMALPAVLRMFTQARKDSFTNEVNTIIKTARQQYLLSGGTDTTWSNAEGSSKSLELTGNSNLKYYIKMNNEGKITKLQVSNGDFQYNVTNDNGIDIATSSETQVVSELEENEILVISNESQSPFTFVNRQNVGSITIGDEVAIDTEHFYVVSSDNANTILLSKCDLKSDGSDSYIQETSPASTNILKVSFLNSDDTAYWDGCQYSNNSGSWACTGTPSGLLSPYSDEGKTYCTSNSGTNCAYVYNSNAVNIYPVVESYANKISALSGSTVTGRLISLEEANSMSVDIINDKNSYYYWFGSSYSSKYVWIIRFDGSFGHADANNTSGIRPVIVVSTDDMPN